MSLDATPEESAMALHRVIKRCLCLLLCGWMSAQGAEPVVELVSGEKEPYIGVNLWKNGYAHEVVTEAFKRSGVTVHISFHPWARANAMAQRGKVDGIVPVYAGAFSQQEFRLSDPFPGDSIGILKRKDNYFQYSVPPSVNLMQALSGLSGGVIGQVRGESTLQELRSIPGIQIEEVTSELQNIDKLAINRIQFVLIDKFTAADLIVGYRPHYIGKLDFVYPPLADKQFHIAFANNRASADKWVTAFNQGLRKMREDGTLDRLRFEYGLLPNVDRGDDKIRLVIGTVNNPDMVIMQELAKAFEAQNPDIELDWRIINESTLRRRLLGDLAISDGQFDVMTIGIYEIPLWAGNGWISPLDPLPKAYRLDDILPTVRQSLAYKDQLYALPFYGESIMTYYRKDLLKKAGLEMPEHPTFANIELIARSLHDPDNQVYGLCLRGKPGWGENVALLSSLSHAFGARWFDMNWAPQLDSKEWRQTLDYYVDLITTQGPPNPTSLGYRESLDLFAQGHCAVWIDATVAASFLYNPEFSQVSDKTGFAPAPRGKVDQSWLWAWSLAIPAASKHKAAAKKFITWATSREYIDLVAKTKGWVAVPPGTRRSTYENPAYHQAAPFSDLVLNAIERSDASNVSALPVPYTGAQYVSINEFSSFGAQISLNFANVLENKMSIDEALKQSQALIKHQMINSGYLKETRN
ncbi:extracellular solute-binding protein [Hahella sp. CR1]|uniref:extracellular solute-binding protein n=1 Tax=Hahella sp. CR1 TaxID=2992807 RepID=UPI0024434D1C|nr:extracellular solute-binding protein [Hahella sp. CR1]MDG9669413.1 extracellular solute-binding protein [Hahella sp. CR1]